MEENRENIREKNLIPFKKGESGNPNGRPLGQKNYATLYREALIKLAEANDKTPDELELDILSKGILNARSGDYRFYKDILDRLHCTAVNKTDMTSNGQPLAIQFSNSFNKDVTTTPEPGQSNQV